MKLLSIIALLLTQTAFANDELLTKVTSEEPTCYGREYSSAHLKSHANQTVQKIQAKFEYQKEYDSNWMELEITLKGEANEFINYRARFVYIAENKTWAIECDGGRVTAKLNKAGNLVIKNEGFVLEGGCGSSEESKTVFLEDKKGGDDVFELVQLPKRFCQKTSEL